MDRWQPSREQEESEGYGHLRSRTDGGQGELDADDEAQLRELKARDREVRTHEQAHVAALGTYAGSVTYDYQMGPDGRMYAVGGSTEIRPAVNATAEQKMQRAQRIRAAVMAVGEPSAADRQAMSEAVLTETQARASFSAKA